MDPFLFIVDLLAVYRLSRLITKDSLLDKPRWWILNRWPSEQTTFPDNLVSEKRNVDGHVYGILPTGVHVYMTTETDDEGDPLWEADRTYKFSELVECPFCASVWIAFAVVALRVWWDWWRYPASALGLAGAVALIFTLWDRD